MYTTHPYGSGYDFSCSQCIEIYQQECGKIEYPYGHPRTVHNEFLENSYLDESVKAERRTDTYSYSTPICPPNTTTGKIEPPKTHKEMNILYDTGIMTTTQEYNPLIETKLNLFPQVWEEKSGMSDGDIPETARNETDLSQSLEECEIVSEENDQIDALAPEDIAASPDEQVTHGKPYYKRSVREDRNPPPKGVPKFYNRRKCWHFDTCTFPSCRFRHTYQRNANMFGSLVGRSELEHLTKKTLKETDETVFEGLVGELNYWYRVANTRPRTEAPVLAIPYEKVVLAVEVIQSFQKVGANDPRDLALRLMPFFQNEVQLADVQRNPKTRKDSK